MVLDKIIGDTVCWSNPLRDERVEVEGDEGLSGERGEGFILGL